MQKDCTGLLEIMEKQLQVYRKLLSLAVRKQPVLVKGDITELEKITKEEEVLILQVGRLEEQRQSLHQALANHFLLSPEALSLSELVKRAGDEEGPAFQKVFGELAKVLKELTSINESNTELIKSSLDFINFSVGTLTNSDSRPGYGEPDEAKKQAAAKIFDRKI